MNTLEQINAYLATTETISLRNQGYTYQQHAAVGMQGSRRSGEKQHLLFAERVVEIHDSPEGQRAAARRIRVGSLLAWSASCVRFANSGTVRYGTPNNSADTKNITCSKCVDRLILTRDLSQ